MKKILLKSEIYAIVDDGDLSNLSKYGWYFDGAYAVTRLPSNKKVYMHRFIMNAVKGQMVDHINGNKFDNRKSNLRFCTKSTNGMNRGKNKNNTSGYKGVQFTGDYKRKKPWLAKIGVAGKQINLGRFFTSKEAGEAYKVAAQKYHKEYAVY